MAVRNEVATMQLIGFLLVVALWVAFGALLLVSQPSLHDTWVRVGELPLLTRAGAWIVFLPWMAATAAWESSWPTILRAVLVAGLAWATIYAFLPWRVQ